MNPQRSVIQLQIGDVFGRLTIRRLPDKVTNAATCTCECTCGVVLEVPVRSLRYSNTKSCGCLRAEKLSQRRLIHGATLLEKTDPIRRTFNVWVSMRARCDNPKNKRYHVYGARGVTYDPEWKAFENFLRDMGPCPKGYSIERDNNDGHYCQENCHWLPRARQAQNRQDTIWIWYRGQAWCFKRLCEHLEKPYLKVYKRYVMRGWDLATSLEIPAHLAGDLKRIDSPQEKQ